MQGTLGIAQPPVFVPTVAPDQNYTALKQAVETFGGQSPVNAKQVNLIYKFRDQLLNQH